MALGSLLAELKRRRVFRVAAAYAVGAWLVIQVAATTFPHLEIPSWMVTAVIVLALLGFPVAIGLAWAFDITPQGLVRTPTSAVDGGDGAPGPWGAQRLAAVGGVLVLALAGGAFIVIGGSLERAWSPVAQDLSIAVLPFRNLSADADNEYFSDGITEDVQRRLSRLGGLQVTSVTSAMSFKGSTKKLREIGDELGVAHLLEGSVRRVGGRLRISVTLVDARTDRSVWTEEFDRDATDVFAIQTEIAEQIAQALRLRLTASERARVGQSGTSSLAAYELYLKAREQENRIGSDMAENRALRAGYVALLRQALAIDPQFAPAHARLATAYLWNYDLAREVAYDSAIAFARRAIRAAPDLADGYFALGAAYRSRNPEDLRPADAEFRRALELDPNNVEALQGRAWIEISDIRLVEALRYTRRAAALAPTDAAIASDVARLYENLGAFGAAEAWYRRVNEIEHANTPWLVHCNRALLARDRGDQARATHHIRDLLAEAPDAPFAWRCAGNVELRLGNLAAARTHLERYAATVTGDDVPTFELAFLALQAGEQERGERLLGQAETQIREQWEYCNGRCSNTGRAMVAAMRGERDEAMYFLHRARRTGWNGWYPTPGVSIHPSLAPLEQDPEYRQLMAELKALFDRQREQATREGLLDPPGAPAS